MLEMGDPFQFVSMLCFGHSFSIFCGLLLYMVFDSPMKNALTCYDVYKTNKEQVSGSKKVVILQLAISRV